MERVCSSNPGTRKGHQMLKLLSFSMTQLVYLAVQKCSIKIKCHETNSIQMHTFLNQFLISSTEGVPATIQKQYVIHQADDTPELRHN